MKRFGVFAAVLFSAFFVQGQQESIAGADLQGQAVDRLLDRATGMMRVTPQSPSAPSACGASRGTITLGTPLNSSFGDCFVSNTYIDFWTFNAQAGQQLRVTFSSTASVLVAIQDYTSGDILADSRAGCGGGLCTSGSFTYTPLSSGPYLVGLGSFTLGTYTVTVDSVGGSSCIAGGTVLCVNSSRFKVTVTWQSTTASGDGTAVALTGDTGYFWFFSANNVELVIKVVDGRPVNNRFWVFVAGLTNVNVVITVTDTQTGAVKIYTNPQGVAFQPIQDTDAFPG